MPFRCNHSRRSAARFFASFAWSQGTGGASGSAWFLGHAYTAGRFSSSVAVRHEARDYPRAILYWEQLMTQLSPGSDEHGQLSEALARTRALL